MVKWIICTINCRGRIVPSFSKQQRVRHIPARIFLRFWLVGKCLIPIRDLGWKCKEPWRHTEWDGDARSHCQLRTLQWRHSNCALESGQNQHTTHFSWALEHVWPSFHKRSLSLTPDLHWRLSPDNHRSTTLNKEKTKSESLNQNPDENAWRGQELLDIIHQKWAALVVGVLHRLICPWSPYLLPLDTF